MARPIRTQKKEMKEEGKTIVEFRKDIVSGDWVLISCGRKKKPNFFPKKERKERNIEEEIKSCPFEDPQKSGNALPAAWYERPDEKASFRSNVFENWFVQVIPNKYPMLKDSAACPEERGHGPYSKMAGIGFHEIVITRDHGRPVWKMRNEEAALLLKTYKERYKALEQNDCVDYILIFHNEGELAGATVPHPHSQIVALPIMPPDVKNSISGAVEYFENSK